MDLKRWGILLAFAAIYIIWGTTYLAIRIVVGEIPPMMSAGLRFLAAGIPFYIWARSRGQAPVARDWMWAAILGALMLTLGNGGVSVAETRIPSGLVSLFVATIPLWVAVIAAALDRKMPAWQTILGVVLGMTGIAILSGEEAGWQGAWDIRFVGLALLAPFGWSIGTVLSRQERVKVPLLQSVAMQMLCGGALAVVVGLAGGEGARWTWEVSTTAWLALAYLVVAGSWIALTSYLWLLQRVPASRVATYAFVNPIVAVAAGAWWFAEPVTPQLLVGAVLIVAAVAVTLLGGRKPVAMTPLQD